MMDILIVDRTEAGFEKNLGKLILGEGPMKREDFSGLLVKTCLDEIVLTVPLEVRTIIFTKEQS